MAKRDRREYARKRYAEDPEKHQAALRASYAKHREKRLADLKAKREVDPEKLRARSREQYAKHKEKRVEAARAYRKANAEKLAAKAREKYNASREIINERRKGYRAKHYDKIYARIREWAKRNPDKVRLHEAKTRLHETTGLARADIPDDLAAAKAEELAIGRWVRSMLDARNARAPTPSRDSPALHGV